MTTPNKAFASVAAFIGGVNIDDKDAVAMFYRREYTNFPAPVRALISDFIIGLNDLPTVKELQALKDAISLPVSKMPSVEAPAWNSKYGPPMQYNVADNKGDEHDDEVFVAF